MRDSLCSADNFSVYDERGSQSWLIDNLKNSSV